MPRDDDVDDWEESLRRCNEEDVGDLTEEVGIGSGHSRWSFHYYRLPDPYLNLTIIRLDGSSFEVQVARTAVVGDLKQAVEQVFIKPMAEDGDKISWSHVWSHFCLCYQRDNLTDDSVSLRSLRVKDGEKLYFIRHVSVDQVSTMREPRNHANLAGKHRRSMTAPEALEKIDEDSTSRETKSLFDRHPDEMCLYSPVQEENTQDSGHKEFSISRFFFKWLSCTGLQPSRQLSSSPRPIRCSDYRGTEAESLLD